MSFPSLLRATTAQCNRHGKILAVAVLCLGALAIMGQVVFIRVLTAESLRHAERLLAAEEWQQVQSAIDATGGTADPQAVLAVTLPALERAVAVVDPAERERVIVSAVVTSLRREWTALSIVAILSCIVGLYGRVFFLVLGAARGTLPLPDAARRAARALPGILAIGLLALLLTAPWPFLLGFLFARTWPAGVPLALFGLIPAVLYLPRLAIAPAIYVQDQPGIRESVRRSLEQTKSQWLRITGYLLGAGAVVWIGVSVAQVAVNLLVRLASPIDAAAFWISSVMAFVVVLGKAYTMVFTVRLKEAVVDGR